MINLALDIGNVLSHVDFDKIVRVVSKELNISLADSLHFLNRVQKLHDLGLTNLSDELSDHFKIKSEVIIQDILYEWNRCINIDMDVIREIEKLQKKHGFEIALVSNIGVEHAKNFKDFYQRSTFPKAIQFFSCEVGARKPTPIYYQTFLSMYPQFKGCIYLDDLDDNVAMGARFGMNARKFDLSSFKKGPCDNMLIGGSKIVAYFNELDIFLTQQSVAIKND